MREEGTFFQKVGKKHGEDQCQCNGKWTRIEDVFRIENGGYSFTRVYLNLNKTTF